MLLHAVDTAGDLRQGTRTSSAGLAESVEMLESMKKAFETIATAKVATSAHEARGLGFLSDSDRITMNRDRVLADAKARALDLLRGGYEPPVPRDNIPAPGENILATLKMGIHLMRQGEYITDYEVKLGHKIAEVLCGGSVTTGTAMTEQYVLDLERQAFKSLCGERKTQERIQYTLKTGKTQLTVSLTGSVDVDFSCLIAESMTASSENLQYATPREWASRSSALASNDKSDLETDWMPLAFSALAMSSAEADCGGCMPLKY